MIQRASGIFLAKMARKKSSSITPALQITPRKPDKVKSSHKRGRVIITYM